MALAIGTLAPDFERTSSDGRTIRLSDYRGKKDVVLFFYPKDFTPVCTAEACGFRDMYEELGNESTEIIGVSEDDDASHRKFAERYKVTYPLLADADRKLVELFDLKPGLLGVVGLKKRVTYVIDKQGRIQSVLDALISADHHLEGVKQALASLGGR
ncbi:MAG: peroxiredoxin [Polyangiaceae bacterium]